MPPGATDPAERARCPGCAEPPAQALPARRPQRDTRSRDRRAHNFDVVRQTGTPGNSCGCTGYDEGSANPEAQARDSSIRSAASAQHPRPIPNQHASYEACDTMHMYGARKNGLENREIALILKGEMSFATETRLVLRFDGNDHLALSMLGYAAAWSGDFDTAREMMDRAIASNPNAAFAWSTRGWTYQVAGNPEEAIRSFERAVLLSPFDPLLFVTLTEMGVAFIGLDRFDEAVVAAKKALNQNPAYVPSYCCLTTALAHLGREAEARNAVARLLELKPHFRISEWAARSDARTHQMFIDGLRRAGIPEWRTVPSLGSSKMMMSARSRLPLLARLRRARCIEQCPSSSAKRKTYARNEFFSV